MPDTFLDLVFWSVVLIAAGTLTGLAIKHLWKD